MLVKSSLIDVRSEAAQRRLRGTEPLTSLRKASAVSSAERVAPYCLDRNCGIRVQQFPINLLLMCEIAGIKEYQRCRK